MITIEGMPRRPSRTSQAEPPRHGRAAAVIEYSRATMRNGHTRVIERQGRARRFYCIDSSGAIYGQIRVLPDLEQLIQQAVAYAQSGARERRDIGQTEIGVLRFRVIAYPGAISIGRMLANGEHIGTLISFTGDELTALDAALAVAQ